MDYTTKKFKLKNKLYFKVKIYNLSTGFLALKHEAMLKINFRNI